MIGIYKITNILNGKVYIGQSVCIESRWASHRSRPFQVTSPTYNYPIYRAIRKYGLQNFSFEVLEECLEEELDNKEIYYISLYDSLNPKKGYNLTQGGHYNNACRKLSEEEVEEIYNLLLKTQLSQEEISKKFNISQASISSINRGESYLHLDYDYPLRKIEKKCYYCADCGRIVSSAGRYCPQCIGKHLRKVEHPNREQLKTDIRLMSFVEVGRKYSVTDNAVRKWCISMNLPSKRSIIKTYSDADWDKI